MPSISHELEYARSPWASERAGLNGIAAGSTIIVSGDQSVVYVVPAADQGWQTANFLSALSNMPDQGGIIDYALNLGNSLAYPDAPRALVGSGNVGGHIATEFANA